MLPESTREKWPAPLSDRVIINSQSAYASSWTRPFPPSLVDVNVTVLSTVLALHTESNHHTDATLAG